MPTTVVSFLGTGQKQNPQDKSSGYRRTTYRFTRPDGGEFLDTTSLFGTALIRFLRETNVAIDRWVVLGTSASLWSELSQVLPNPDDVIEQYCQIDDRVIARNVDQHALQEWQRTLNEHAAPLELRLCLTGEALDPASQQQIARALFENIPRENNVVFDISHGFRHQPVIATFLVSLMRWTHQIRSVRLFSGVFEARKDEVTPVLEMPICQELVNATEAAATLALTGNFEPVARCLGRDAELAWFLENTNQVAIARRHAQDLQIDTTEYSDVVQSQLAELLHERLRWAEGDRFADRVLESARTALEANDYFRAIVLGYEALLIRAGQILYPNADPLSYQSRLDAEKALFDRLTDDDRELLMDLQHTRNACAHGTRSDRASVQQILGRPQEFRCLVERAFTLFDRLPQLLSA
jgi:CRISPR-associated Csx2 family protein